MRPKAYIQLGRIGDILNILPLMWIWLSFIISKETGKLVSLNMSGDSGTTHR